MKKAERYASVGAALVVGVFIGARSGIHGVYAKCMEVNLPRTACDAFGRGELPSAEYTSTNVHYHECLGGGGTRD